MKLGITIILCAYTASFLTGCNQGSTKTDLKSELKEQREAQKSTDEQLRKNTEKVNELLVRNEAMLRQLDQLARIETKLSEFEEKRLEELREATKPRNVTADTAAEAALKMTALTDPKIRALTCPLLSRLGGKAAEDKLEELVKTDRNPDVRTAALQGLIDMGSKRVTAILNEAILVAQGRNLQSMTRHLRDHCDESSRKPVLSVLHTLKRFDSHEEESVRENLYEILGRVGKPEDAEALKYFLEKERSKTTVMKTLLKIDPKKATTLLNQALATATKEHVRQIAQFLEKHADDTSRDPIFQALDSLIVSEDYNAKQARECLYRALVPIAKPEDNLRIEKLLRIESSSRNGLLSAYVKTGSARKTDVFKQLKRSVDGYNPISKAAFVALSDYVDIRATDFLVSYMAKNNDYSTSPTILGMLIKLKDPKAAAALVSWSQRGRSNTRQLIVNAIREGYPGTTYDAKTKRADVVSEDAMKELLKAREKRIQKLESGTAEAGTKATGPPAK